MLGTQQGWNSLAPALLGHSQANKQTARLGCGEGHKEPGSHEGRGQRFAGGEGSRCHVQTLRLIQVSLAGSPKLTEAPTAQPGQPQGGGRWGSTVRSGSGEAPSGGHHVHPH